MGKLSDESTVLMAAVCSNFVAFAFEKLVIEIAVETIWETKYILDSPDET